MIESANNVTELSDARDELRARIEASERRIAQRTVFDQAREAAQAATTYTRQNPIKVVSGAITIGLVLGLLSTPGRRAAASAVSSVASGTAKTVSAAAKKRSAALTGLLADAAIAYGIRVLNEALDRAHKEQEQSAQQETQPIETDAANGPETITDKPPLVRERARRRAERVVRNLTDRVRG